MVEAVLPVPPLLLGVKAAEVEEVVGEAGAAGAGSGACRRTPTTPEHHLAVDDLPMPLHWNVSEVH